VGTVGVEWSDQHRPRLEKLATAIDGHVAPADTLVEVGSVPWVLPGKVVTSPLEYHALNLDTSERVVETGDRRIRNHECNVETDRWPFEDGRVDCVVMGAVLEHLTDPAAALGEARRVLSEAGTLVLSTPNALRLIQRVRMATGTNPWDGFDAGGNRYHRHNREWAPREVRDLLHSVGFSSVSIDTTTLRRSGVAGRVYELFAGMNPRWDDDILAVAHPRGNPAHVPACYRKSLVDREDDTRAAVTSAATTR
jgi:SAM-dependent methyltransferase